jgi:hypothetical protein
LCTTPVPSPTSPVPPSSPVLPAPYTGSSLAELRQRTYGGGELIIVETLQNHPTFTRYLVRYPSDGLTVYGFMNVPRTGENWPVALVLHGYVPEATYRVQTYTTRYADALAEAGYLVIHPNYRNFPPSDTGGDNLFRVDYAVDVLNLMAIVRGQSQDPAGVLRRADGEYIWIEARGRLVFENGESLGRGVGLLADVSSRKRIESRLGISALILQGIREAVAVVDAAGRIGWANAAVRDGGLQLQPGYVSGRAPRDAAFRRALQEEQARLGAERLPSVGQAGAHPDQHFRQQGRKSRI